MSDGSFSQKRFAHAFNVVRKASASSRGEVPGGAARRLEAYERKLLCADTRFDRWTRGEVQLTRDELAGADSFIRDGCAGCHNGPSFSDGKFHAPGIGGGDSTAGVMA